MLIICTLPRASKNDGANYDIMSFISTRTRISREWSVSSLRLLVAIPRGWNRLIPCMRMQHPVRDPRHPQTWTIVCILLQRLTAAARRSRYDCCLAGNGRKKIVGQAVCSNYSILDSLKCGCRGTAADPMVAVYPRIELFSDPQ